MNITILLSWTIISLIIVYTIVRFQLSIYKVTRGKKVVILLAYNTTYGRNIIILFEYERPDI